MSPTVAINSLQPGQYCQLDDLIDGERRQTIYRREDNRKPWDQCIRNPAIWCRTTRIGFVQTRVDGSFRTRAIGDYHPWYTDINTRVTPIDVIPDWLLPEWNPDSLTPDTERAE